jgi:transketolase
VLWVLYDQVLRVRPETVHDPNRDRFCLSKGHGPQAYYAVLAATGFIARDLQAGFAGFNSILGHHPDRLLVPGAEISGGSLGHGLPLAVGTAPGLPSTRPRTAWTRPRCGRPSPGSCAWAGYPASSRFAATVAPSS